MISVNAQRGFEGSSVQSLISWNRDFQTFPFLHSRPIIRYPCRSYKLIYQHDPGNNLNILSKSVVLLFDPPCTSSVEIKCVQWVISIIELFQILIKHTSSYLSHIHSLLVYNNALIIMIPLDLNIIDLVHIRIFNTVAWSKLLQSNISIFFNAPQPVLYGPRKYVEIT